MFKLRVLLAALVLVLGSAACSTDLTGPSATSGGSTQTKEGEDSPYVGTGTGKA